MGTVQIIVTVGGTPSLFEVTDQLFVTDTPLGATDAYTSPVFSSAGIVSIRGKIKASKAGVLVLQTSDDGETWDTVSTTTISANSLHVINDTPPGGVLRYKFTNGATAEVSLRFSAYALKGVATV